MSTKSLREISADAECYWKRYTVPQGNRIGVFSIVAFAAAVVMFVSACAESENTARSSNGQGHQRRARVADVSNSQQPQGTMYSEAEYDFGDADAYYNAHPSGGGPN